MAKYGTKLTTVGIAKLANAQVSSSKVQITHIAVGDGNGVAYTPTGAETALKREQWRGTVNKAELGEGNTIIVEGIVPATVGGFTMREVGLYDADGAMIAIGNYPDTEKTTVASGVAGELILRTIIKVANTSAVDLTINADVVTATKSDIDGISAQLAQSKVNPLFLTTGDTESAALSTELVNGNGWTLGNGWTGNFTSGFTHAIGSVEPLVFPLGASAGKIYEVVFTVESTDADHGFKLNVTVGDSFPFEIYRGAGNEIVYRNGIETDFAGDLKFIPKTNFTGTVKNISVKEIVGFVNPSTAFFDKDEVLNHEMRTTKTELNNLFLGKRSGQRNTSGNHNTSTGIGALSQNTSGYFNTAFGFNALLRNTIGSRNVALAYAALRDNVSGHRNVAIGTFALNRNTHGHNNIAVGADALWYNTTGNHNIAMGLTAQEHNVSGNGNIAIGYRSLLENEVSHFNVVIGYDAGRKIQSTENVVMGAFAGDGMTTGRQNTLIGSYVMRSNIVGERNVGLGAFAGKTITGSNNVVLGYNAADGLSIGANNIFIGANTTTSNATRQNWLNIGNSLYADMINHAYGIGIENPTAILHLKAATAARPALKLTASTELTVQRHGGAFEFDGTFLYFTTNDGVRRKIQLEGQAIVGSVA